MTIKVIGNGGFTGSPIFEYEPGFIFTGDPACKEYDWLVVFDELPKRDIGTFQNGYEPLACSPAHTILCTWEPVSVKPYSRAYTRQFAHYLTNRPFAAECHPGYHFGRGYYPWFVGRRYADICAKKDYPKEHLISAVFSAKRMHVTAHHYRYDLVNHLKNVLPELEWFGRGFNPIDFKFKLLDGYRYHLTVENHIASGHWSEKLSDPLLCECLPFYAGDPHISDILPAEAVIPIPIDDPREAERIIRAAMAEDAYSKHLPAIRAAKQLLLRKYNFWAQVIAVIRSAQTADKPQFLPVLTANRIYARKVIRRRHPLAALDDAWHHLQLICGYYPAMPHLSDKA